MRKINLAGLLFLVAIFTSKSQQHSGITLRLYSNKTEVAKGECLVITASLLLKETNTLDFSFHEFPSQSDEITQILKQHFSYFGGNQLYRPALNTNPHDEEYVSEFKLITLGGCLTDDVTIAPVELKLLNNEDSSIVTLKSNELEIKTSYQKDATSADFIGDFRKEVDDLKIASRTGDTTTFSYCISGYGNLFPFHIKDFENDRVRFTSTQKSFMDTIFYNSYSYKEPRYYNKKCFNVQVIHKQQGSFNINEYISISSFSTENKKSDTLSLDLEFSIQGQDVRLPPVLPPENLVILLDNSESMRIEDYKPNRFAAAKEFADMLLVEKCNPFYLVAGDIIRVNKCSVGYDLLDKPKRRGTALSNGFWHAIKDLRNLEGTKGIVLITDGDETASNVDLMEMVRLAEQENIQIFPVGVGSHGPVPFGTDF